MPKATAEPKTVALVPTRIGWIPLLAPPVRASAWCLPRRRSDGRLCTRRATSRSPSPLVADLAWLDTIVESGKPDNVGSQMEKQ